MHLWLSLPCLLGSKFKLGLRGKVGDCPDGYNIIYSTPICEKAKEFLKVSTSKEYVEVDGEQKRVCMTKNQEKRTMICVDEDQGINDTIPQDIPCCFSVAKFSFLNC